MRPSTKPTEAGVSQFIVIVGGVAAGASAATRARRMDESARIVLFEKDEHISFANCGLPYYLGGEITERRRLLVATPELLERRFRIEVRTLCEVVGIDRANREVEVLDRRTGTRSKEHWDKLILAPGASPIVPPLAGADAENVFVLRNLADTDRLQTALAAGPRRAVVVGAGFIGIEMAEQLRRRGLAVALVELQGQVQPPLDADIAGQIARELGRHGVDLHLGAGLAGFTEPGARVSGVRLSDGTELPADLVVLGIGVRPNTRLAQEAGIALGPTGGIAVDDFGRTSAPDIYAAGDAAEQVHGIDRATTRVPLAGPANRAGRIAGQHAATGSSRSTPLVLGTAIVRAFELTAAATGLSEKTCRAQGIAYRKLVLQARHHAGYYPGAQDLLLKVLYAPDTGRLLGAQAVGAEGVDKRIDVIAAVLHFGGTVDDLTELDLAYAPPFGSAKDPLHMAGFMGRNQLDGLVDWVDDDATLGGMQVVDVRTAGEVRAGMLAGAIHIPLDDLRERLSELDAKRPTAVVCRSGQRAWVAARILTQHGFDDVKVLPGGMVVRG